MTLIYSHIMHFAAFSSLAICLYVGAHLGKFSVIYPLCVTVQRRTVGFHFYVHPFFVVLGVSLRLLLLLQLSLSLFI